MRVTLRWIPVLVLAVPALAMADTVRMRSGMLLEGKVADRGDRLTVQKGDEVLSVRWRDVDVVLKDRTPGELYAERLARAGKDAEKLYAVALWAERAGLVKEHRATLERAVAADPEHKAARTALAQQKQDGAWLTGSKLLKSKGFVARDGKWVLSEEAAHLDRMANLKELSKGEVRAESVIEKAGSDDARVAKLAATALASFSPADIKRPALRVLRRGQPLARVAAARTLARIDEVEMLRPLIHSAIMDTDSRVRKAALASAQAIGHADLIKPFGKALFSKHAQVRMNAGEALGRLGGPTAVEYLVRRVQTAGGLGNRNNISVMRQLSYIADFDVEIAQAAQIGDPIVQTLRDGVVLDCRVLGVREEFSTVERRVIYGALSRATGKEDLGQDALAWSKWWREEGKTAMAAAHTPKVETP